MPVIFPSSYKPPLFLHNSHIQTIWHSEFRRVDGVFYQRSRIDTPDGDFLDLDWIRNGRSRLAILIHGLESSTSRGYMKGMVKALSARDFDCLAMSLRGCSGEPNRLPTFYHAGKTDDIETTVNHAHASGYRSIYLIGFSLGGNMVLRWLGEKGTDLPHCLKAAAAVSAPCDLVSSSVALNRFSNRIYNKRFVRKLIRKVRAKGDLIPDLLEPGFLDPVKTLEEFDDLFTSRRFGFDGVKDYYQKASSAPLLNRITCPTLLLNAQDDPFLGPGCFPEKEARASSCFHLESPEHGGHIGFLTGNLKGEFWHERRVAEFFSTVQEDEKRST